MNKVIAQTSVAPETLQAQFLEIFRKALEAGQAAVRLDPKNYENHIDLGRVYEAVVPIRSIKGAYETALESYQKALAVNPEAPIIYLNLARLELANGDTKKARNYISQGLAKKTNYTELIFLSSQIDAREGNIPSAIASAEQAAVLAPSDVGVWFQLGLLKYTNKDYRGAVAALEKAVSLNANYSNALYFLGLSYDQLELRPNAIAAFERIGTLNPDNAEVKAILVNLKAGRGALTTISPPSPAPEKRKAPPVKEAR